MPLVQVVEEEDEQFGPLLVNELEKHGISAQDVKKLQVRVVFCFLSYGGPLIVF